MNLKDKLALLSATILTAGMVVSTPALAQTNPPAAQAEEEEEEEEIIVTGSRLRQTAFTSASPIGVITAEEATLEGTISAAEIVQGSSAVGGAFQVNTQLTGFVTTGGPGAQTISLRGLGAQRTLVLLNGRRVGPAGVRGTVGPVDLNVIPSSLLQRVEILKDGASSIYGSDALAGVVNYITRTDLDGFELNAFADGNEQGGGERSRINASWGTTWDGGYFNIGGEYFEQQALRNRDRDDTACAANYVFDPVTGARIDHPNTDPGQVYEDDTYKCFNLFARVIRTEFGDLIYEDPGVNYVTPGNNSPIPGLARQNRTGTAYDPVTIAYGHQDHPYYANSTAISPTTVTSAAANFGLDINAINGELYAELLVSRRESEQYSSRQFFPGVNAANPANQVINGGYNFASILPIIPGTLIQDQTVDYYRLAAGLRGEFGDTGWDYDVYLQSSKSDGEYGSDTYINDRVLAVTGAAGCNQAAIVISDGGTNNAISDGPANQCALLAGQGGYIPWTSARVINGDFNAAERAFLITYEYGNTTYKQDLIEAFVSGNAFELPAGPVGIGVGAQWRREEIDDTPGFNQRSANLWGLSAAGRTAGSDRVLEYFGELSVPLVRDLPLFESLDINMSARHVDYSSYGQADVYKVGLNWQVTPDWRIRASQGTSFRAPALYELYLANQSSFANQLGNDPCIQWDLSTNLVLQQNCIAAGVPAGYTNAGTSSITVFAGGGAASGLEAEDSLAQTFGVIWTPGDLGLSVALDYFDIDVRGEITQFGTANILFSCYTSLQGPAFGNTDPFCGLHVRNTVPPGSWNNITGGQGHQVASVQNNYTNVASQGNRGVDLNVRYRTDLGPGQFTFTGEFTYMLEDIVQIFSTGVANNFLGNSFNYRGPDLTGRWSLRYDLNDWTYTWSSNLVGDWDNTNRPTVGNVTNSVSFGNPNRAILSKERGEQTIYHDFSVRRIFETEGGLDMSLVVGVANMFDERPPADSSTSTGAFRRGIASLNGYDMVGRRAFVNLSFGW